MPRLPMRFHPSLACLDQLSYTFLGIRVLVDLDILPSHNVLYYLMLNLQ
jgi:hypothetical protein